jgi:uncharacterized protein YkwD
MPPRVLLPTALLAALALLLVACQTPGAITMESSLSDERFVTLDYGDFGDHDPERAEEMLALINGERASGGLPALQMDGALEELAVEYASEMAQDDFFAHLTRDGRGPFDRMSSFYITYTHAGENLALAPSVEVAHHQLMASEGHRANILGASYGRAGIAVLETDRGLLIVQEFTD